MATSAISSGTIAIHEAKTKARTSSAPPPAISASTARLAPPSLPPSAAAARSASRPVTWTGAPPTVTPSSGGLGRRASAWPGSTPPLAGIDTSAKVVRPSSETNVRSCVDAYEATRAPGSAALTFARAASRSARDAGRVDRRARRQRDDRDERRDVAAVAVGLGDLAVGGERLLAGDVELLLEAPCRPAPWRRTPATARTTQSPTTSFLWLRTHRVRVVIGLRLAIRVCPLSS